MVVCPVINEVCYIVCCYFCKIADGYFLAAHVHICDGKIFNVVKFASVICIGKPAVINDNGIDHIVGPAVDIQVCTNSCGIKGTVFDHDGLVTRISSCAVLNRYTTAAALEVACVHVIEGIVFHLVTVSVMSHTDTVSACITPAQSVADIYIVGILCIPCQCIAVILIKSRNRCGKSITRIVMSACEVVIISHGQCAVDGQILCACHIQSVYPRLIVRCQTFDVI